MTNTPQTSTGTGGATITFDPPCRMVLIENLDSSIAITVKYNGDATGWSLLAASRKGNYFKGGVKTVVLTPDSGSPKWQIEGTDPCR